jgi:hypothetical protein
MKSSWSHLGRAEAGTSAWATVEEVSEKAQAMEGEWWLLSAWHRRNPANSDPPRG